MAREPGLRQYCFISMHAGTAARPIDQGRTISKPIKTILREAKLKQINFEDLKTNDFNYPHICALQNTSSKIDNLAAKLLDKPNNGKYKIGEELIGVNYHL